MLGMSVITTGFKDKSNHGPILASDSYYNTNTVYKEKLDIEHVDVPPNDESVMGQLVRGVTSLVGGLFSPKCLIVVFRLLKFLTFCCRCLTIATELIYLFFVKLQVSSAVLQKLGETRDEVIRVYDIVLAFLAIFIGELLFIKTERRITTDGFMLRFNHLLIEFSFSTLHQQFTK